MVRNDQSAIILDLAKIPRNRPYLHDRLRTHPMPVIPHTEIASLFRQHASGLTLLARSRFLESMADDVVQEAFIRLSQQAKRPDDPLAWLARTVRNLAIDAIRQEGRRKTREQKLAATREPWFDSGFSFGSEEVTAEEATMALTKLTVEEREIVVAHLWGNMTFRQIAQAFDLSSSSANRQYQNAISQLRELLGTKHV